MEDDCCLGDVNGCEVVTVPMRKASGGRQEKWQIAKERESIVVVVSTSCCQRLF